MTVTVSMSGPLARVWTLILGRDIAATLQGDLDRLVEVAENPEGAERVGVAEGAL